MAESRGIYLLGISCNIHESSAALVKDGVLIAAAEEERFTRRKQESRFPERAIAYCLREAGITMRDVSYAGFYWQPWKGLLKPLQWVVRYRVPADVSARQGVARVGRHPDAPHRRALRAAAHGLPRRVSLRRPSSRARGQRLLRVTVRVGGDSHHRPVRRKLPDPPRPRPRRLITPIKRFYLPHSLGIFYAGLTHFLGYQVNGDEYEIDGARGVKPAALADTFAQMVRFEDGELVNDSSWFTFHTGSAICYSPRFVAAFGAPCPDEQHVDRRPYSTSPRAASRCSRNG